MQTASEREARIGFGLLHWMATAGLFVVAFAARERYHALDRRLDALERAQAECVLTHCVYRIPSSEWTNTEGVPVPSEKEE